MKSWEPEAQLPTTASCKHELINCLNSFVRWVSIALPHSCKVGRLKHREIHLLTVTQGAKQHDENEAGEHAMGRAHLNLIGCEIRVLLSLCIVYVTLREFGSSFRDFRCHTKQGPPLCKLLNHTKQPHKGS